MPQKPELSAGLTGPREPNADFNFRLWNHLKYLLDSAVLHGNDSKEAVYYPSTN